MGMEGAESEALSLSPVRARGHQGHLGGGGGLRGGAQKLLSPCPYGAALEAHLATMT